MEIQEKQIMPLMSPSTPSSSSYRLLRRAVMKTQATQTEISGAVKIRSSRSMPANLTLSSRANNQQMLSNKNVDMKRQQLHQHHRQRNSLADSSDDNDALSLIKSRSVHGTSDNINDGSDEEEVMQVCPKEHKPRKIRKSRDTKDEMHQRMQVQSKNDNDNKSQIMMRFKPARKSYPNCEALKPKNFNVDYEGIENINTFIYIKHFLFYFIFIFNRKLKN
jgi:hypothetical protein